MKKVTQKQNFSVIKKAILGTYMILLIGFQAIASSINTSSNSNLMVETNRVWINVTSTQGAFSQTLMGYRTNATDGIDYGLDGAFMNDGAISIASLINDVRYAIQFKGVPFTVNDVVPLSFTATSTGSYTFAIDRVDGFFTNSDFAVYVHDKVTNTYNNLKTGSYTFTANAGMYNNRFELTYSQSSNALATNENNFTAANLVVFQNNGNLFINGGTTLLKNIAIYSINGQLLYKDNQVTTNQVDVAFPSISGQPIIIKVTTQEGVMVSKKWLLI